MSRIRHEFRNGVLTLTAWATTWKRFWWGLITVIVQMQIPIVVEKEPHAQKEKEGGDG